VTQSLSLSVTVGRGAAQKTLGRAGNNSPGPYCLGAEEYTEQSERMEPHGQRRGSPLTRALCLLAETRKIRLAPIHAPEFTRQKWTHRRKDTDQEPLHQPGHSLGLRPGLKAAGVATGLKNPLAHPTLVCPEIGSGHTGGRALKQEQYPPHEECRAPHLDVLRQPEADVEQYTILSPSCSPAQYALTFLCSSRKRSHLDVLRQPEADVEQRAVPRGVPLLAVPARSISALISSCPAPSRHHDHAVVVLHAAGVSDGDPRHGPPSPSRWNGASRAQAAVLRATERPTEHDIRLAPCRARSKIVLRQRAGANALVTRGCRAH